MNKKTINKILSFKTTDTNKSFCFKISNSSNDVNNISKEMYYADIEDTLDVTKTLYNKGCLRDNNGKIYSSLYNVKDLYLKSAIYCNGIETTIPNTNSFQNVFNYRLSSDLTNQIQIDNHIYQLNNSLNIGKQSFSQDIYAELSLNNGYVKMPNIDISTYIFKRGAILDAISAEKDEIMFASDDISNINGVQYNQIFEIPGNVKNDYDSGNYAANVYTTKNQYNSLYDMSHDFKYILKNARTYIAIDHCNNQLYLKYYDNVNLSGRLNSEPVSIDDSNTSALYNHKYQKIEVIDLFNRYEAVNAHKTNYYDIDSVCEKMFQSFNKMFNDLNGNETLQKEISCVKQNLQYEIQNCIEDICKQVTPVDTQLVKVNILESEIDL